MAQAFAVGPNEQEELATKLGLSRERFLAAIAGVDEEDEKVCAKEGSWSLLQIAEHLVIVEERFRTRWLQEAQPGSTPREWDEKYRTLARDRSAEGKRQAPEVIRPTGRFESLEHARDEFIRERAETIRVIRHELRDLRAFVIDHRLGLMDGYQLFTLLSGHTERHAEQAMEVKETLRCPE